MQKFFSLYHIFWIATLLWMGHVQASDNTVDYYQNPERLDFNNTLLIINYNNPHYDSIPFLKKAYSTVFPHLVFYGEKSAKNIVTIKHGQGYFGQNVLADAMKRWPYYEGYILCQDDCWMNFWNFARLDRNKIWFSPVGPGTSLDLVHHPWWQWWNFPFGRDAILSALKKLPKKALRMLEQNMGVNKVGIAWADFVYVPARFRKDYISLCHLFDSPPTFLELATPNILLCLDLQEHWEVLQPLWGIQNISEQYQTDYDWIHPIKFSNLGYRKFMETIFEPWNARYNCIDH